MTVICFHIPYHCIQIDQLCDPQGDALHFCTINTCTSNYQKHQHAVCNVTGEFTPGKIGQWRFDKRSWGGTPIPRNLGPPPTNMKNDLVRALINSFNEATDAIPCWDQYAAAKGKVSRVEHDHVYATQLSWLINGY
jgi:hypothetical protein